MAKSPKFITKDHAQLFADKMISLIEAGNLPWRKPWATSGGHAARNLVSGSTYSGINVLLLLVSTIESGFTSPFWLSMKQANDLGGKVKKGSKGTAITFYTAAEVDDKKAEGGKKTIHVRKFFTVFNLDQVEGIEAPVLAAPVFAEQTQDERKEALEFHLSQYRLQQGIGYAVKGDSAYYSPTTDRIVMPTNFLTVEGYCGVLAHEHAHSTGHKTRLNRFSDEAVNTKAYKDEYAAEELVAEISAGLLCGSFGIESDLENHASYIESWLKHLKNDKEFIFKAASKAVKAINLIAECASGVGHEAAA